MSEAPFQAPSIESIASLFPAFDFDHLIAQGGMGAVYKARQRSLDRHVAIKILPHELGDDPQFRASFEAEAKVMARVVHPNLITIHDSGDVGGLLYIVMEYIEGKSLFHSAHQKSVHPKQAVEIVLRICRGLAEAHENGIVHRDIKPANILLTPKREPKIGDFGLARATRHDSEGLAMGTPGYTAAEVIHHPERADHRSDIFSVGAILRELLTGKPPEDDTNADHDIGDPKLLEICKMASNSDPSERYQKVEAMASDLESWLAERAATPSAPRTADRSASSSFGRNCAIIVVLLAAIFASWKLLERKKAITAASVEETTQAKEAAPLPTPPPELPAPTPPTELTEDPALPAIVEEARPETPAQSLLRLREDLVKGNFEELPVGTLSWKGSHFFYVSRATSWHSASRMARAFGGHLPLLNDENLRVQLAAAIPADIENAPDKQSAWIGANRHESTSWQNVTGRLWQLESKPQGSGGFAAVNRDGTIEAGSSADQHPFFIQWHHSGFNPTRIRELLALSGGSQMTKHPFFPPGTETHGDFRFLIVEEPITLSKARFLAKVSGGKLFSAGTQKEADWLGKAVKGIAAPDGLWLGATFQSQLWTWSDLQPWTFARWAPNSKPGSGDALLILPDSGWAPADRDKIASGFVIEWSEETPPETASTSFVDLDDMDKKAANFLIGPDAKRNKDAADNADDYIWKLNIWLRRQRINAEIEAWTPRVQKIKAAVQNGRLPANIPRTPNKLYPKPLLEIARHYLRKQQVIDQEFITRATSIRDSYASRLKTEASKARELGQRETAAEISEKVQAAAKIEAWVKSFGFIFD